MLFVQSRIPLLILGLFLHILHIRKSYAALYDEMMVGKYCNE